MRFWLVLCLTIFGSMNALAAGKVALVIGNGAYINANKLPNPPNDATDMMAALQQLGFEVIGGTDLDYAAMGAKIGEFEDAAREADVTLFFYAGHGLQVNGRNFLVPINAKLDRESSLQFEAIDAETVLRSMSGPNKTAIALLDACRDNPLSRSFARSLGKTRSTAVQQGLAVPSIVGGGMLIGFSTAPGEVAADGEGHNSPFTTALLKNLAKPGLEIQQLMTRVKADVFQSTKETQEPWHNSSLRSEVYLNGETPAAVTATPKQDTPSPQISSSIEVEWNAVRDTNSTAVLDAFMAAHADNPVFTALAQDRKAAIQHNTDMALLDSLKIPEEQPSAKAGIKLEALKNLKKPLIKVLPKPEVQRSSTWSLDTYFDSAKAANEGQTVYALLGPPLIDLTPPPKNPATKAASLNLTQITTAPSLDALIAANPDLGFAYDQVTSCRLDWIDRCTFVPQAMVQGLAAAMQAKGLDMLDHSGNYYTLSRIANSDDYLLSNAPDFRDGTVAIVAAIVTADLEIKDIYGFDLAKSKLGLEAGAPEAGVEVTGVAMDGEDFYISFDGSQRCTDKKRSYGFIAKFSQADHSLKWVSPLNVSDANLLLSNGRLLSANGGSCVEDFLYDINTETGVINARAKLPSAVERMDLRDGRLVLELYDSAGVYQLP